MSATVLVTGGAGFIGSNLVRRLLNRGAAVKVIDTFAAFQRGYIAGREIERHEVDILDLERLRQVARGCHSMVHLAAATSVVESVRDPASSLRVNVKGTLNALRAAADCDVSRLVFASSNAVVGDTGGTITEQSVPRPISPYGASKLSGEAYCNAFARCYGLETVILRFANAYGPYSDHKTSVIAKFCQLLQSNRPLSIYGDGLQTRDYVYVDDVTRAIDLALSKSVSGETFQIGTGAETSVRDLVDMLSALGDARPVVDWHPQPDGEIRRVHLDVSKSARMLGFTPSWSLADGLPTTWDWLQRDRRASPTGQ